MEKGRYQVDMEEMKKLYIAGAHSRSRTLKAYMNYLYPDVEVLAYLVSKELQDENPDFIDGIPVYLIERSRLEEAVNRRFPVCLGTRGMNHSKLAEELSAVGFSKIIPVTADIDRELRKAYMEKWYREHGREFILIEDLCAE